MEHGVNDPTKDTLKDAPTLIKDAHQADRISEIFRISMNGMQ